MVPVVGIEPTRCHQQRILNPLDTCYSSLLLLTLAASTSCFCKIFSLGLVNSRLQEYAGMDQRLSYFYHTWGWWIEHLSGSPAATRSPPLTPPHGRGKIEHRSISTGRNENRCSSDGRLDRCSCDSTRGGDS